MAVDDKILTQWTELLKGLAPGLTDPVARKLASTIAQPNNNPAISLLTPEMVSPELLEELAARIQGQKTQTVKNPGRSLTNVQFSDMPNNDEWIPNRIEAVARWARKAAYGARQTANGDINVDVGAPNFMEQINGSGRSKPASSRIVPPTPEAEAKFTPNHTEVLAHAGVVGGVVLAVDGVSRTVREARALGKVMQAQAEQETPDMALAKLASEHRAKIAGGVFEGLSGAGLAIASLYMALKGKNHHREPSGFAAP